MLKLLAHSAHSFTEYANDIPKFLSPAYQETFIQLPSISLFRWASRYFKMSNIEFLSNI